MYGYTTCLIIPIHGRLWLPPDCEETSVMLGRLWTHYDRQCKAEHKGDEHVGRNQRLKKKTTEAMSLVLATHMQIYAH